jgi:hypothetical protein
MKMTKIKCASKINEADFAIDQIAKRHYQNAKNELQNEKNDDFREKDEIDYEKKRQRASHQSAESDEISN